MQRNRALPLLHEFRLFLYAIPALFLVSSIAPAQVKPEAKGYFARVNSFGFFAAFSNDSSHIILGNVENRKLLSFGVYYGRRIWLNHVVNWQYNGELAPVALESDPVQVTTTTFTYTNPPATLTTVSSEPTPSACHPSSGSGSIPDGGPTYTYTSTCSRRWTMGAAISPVGFQWNFLPRRKLQPYVIGHGGYMFSTQPIPISTAGSFNFTFDLGAGVEFFRARSQSIRVEYRYHHISNNDTAFDNPGIDSGLLQVTYSLGR